MPKQGHPTTAPTHVKDHLVPRVQILGIQINNKREVICKIRHGNCQDLTFVMVKSQSQSVARQPRRSHLLCDETFFKSRWQYFEP